MTLQAWFDDSGSKGVGRWMTLAGLFGEAELFASLSDEWDRHLRAKHPGAIRYFKMDEACGLDGQFRHWREDNRDAKVRQLARIIDREDLTVISARIDLEAFEKIGGLWDFVKPEAGDLVRHHAMGQPYILLFQNVLTAAVTEAVDRGATAPIEIIFDDQAILRQTILAGYPELRTIEEAIPERLAVMPVQPWFRNDMDFVMLQAADLIAGDMRIGPMPAEKRPQFSSGLFSKLRMSGYCIDVDEETMVEAHNHLVDALEREAKRKTDGNS